MLTIRNPRRLNRLATAAAVPLLVFGAVVAARYGPQEKPPPPPLTGTLVVANLRQETLSFFDATKPGAAAEVLLLPGPPHEMVEAGGRLYVTLGRANALIEVDPAAPVILRRVSLTGSPHGLAVDRDSLWVTLDDDDEAVRLDRATLAVTARVPTGRIPHAAIVGGGELYIANSAGASLTVWAEAGMRTIAAGAGAESLALVGGRVMTANAADGTVSEIDLASGGARTIMVGARPSRIVAVADETVAVALHTSREVVLLSTRSATVERRLEVDAAPDGLCVAPGGGWFAVVSGASGLMAIFEADGSRREERGASVGAGGGACLWLGSG